MGPQSCQDIENQKSEDFGNVDPLCKSIEANVPTKAKTSKDGNPVCNSEGGGSYPSDTDLTNMSKISIPEKNHHLRNEFEQKEKQDRHTESDGIKNPDISMSGSRKIKYPVCDASPPSLPKGFMRYPRKKLLILDINGLLADIVCPMPKGYKADTTIARRAIFNRPYYLDFVEFCLEKFEVAIWSSRNKRNVELVVNYLIGDMKQKLLFCWDASYCTVSKFTTLENRHKPLVFKDLRKVWERNDLNHSRDGIIYNESNTLLVDDSPYKALLNPLHTAIFPRSFRYSDENDDSLGPGGALRVYLEKVAAAENVQKYVEQNPFGESAITESSNDWSFYSDAINSVTG